LGQATFPALRGFAFIEAAFGVNQPTLAPSISADWILGEGEDARCLCHAWL